MVRCIQRATTLVASFHTAAMGDKDESGPPSEESKIMDGEEKASAIESASEPESEEQHLYGWFCFTPSWMQWANTIVYFLVVMCIAVLGQSMMVNGLIAVSMSSIETRFDMSSSQSGTIPASYELAGIPVLLIVGYYGAVIHRPRWLAVGMFILSCASLIYALPHFTTGLYEWSSSVDDNLCHPNSNR